MSNTEPNYTSPDNTKQWTVGVAIACILLALLLGGAAYLGHKDSEVINAAPCSSFSQTKLSDLPARCVTSQGGFKL